MSLTPEDLEALEVVGMRFGWRAYSLATGEQLSDDDLRALMKRRSLSGGKRTWVTKQVLGWPQHEGGLSDTLHGLRELYESNARLRQAFAAADGQRMFEKWLMKGEGGLDASGERPDEVHVVNVPSDSEPPGKTAHE